MLDAVEKYLKYSRLPQSAQLFYPVIYCKLYSLVRSATSNQLAGCNCYMRWTFLLRVFISAADTKCNIQKSYDNNNRAYIVHFQMFYPLSTFWLTPSHEFKMKNGTDVVACKDVFSWYASRCCLVALCSSWVWSGSRWHPTSSPKVVDSNAELGLYILCDKKSVVYVLSGQVASYM